MLVTEPNRYKLSCIFVTSVGCYAEFSKTTCILFVFLGTLIVIIIDSSFMLLEKLFKFFHSLNATAYFIQFSYDCFFNRKQSVCVYS